LLGRNVVRPDDAGAGAARYGERVRALRTLVREWPALLVIVLAQVEIWGGIVHGPRLAAMLTAIGMTLPLLARRRAPILVLAVVVPSTFVRQPLGVELNEGLTPIAVMLVAFYAVGMYASRRASIAAVAGGLAFVLATMAVTERENLGDFPFVALFMVGPWAAAFVVRARELRTEALELHAHALERDREEKARAAVAAERRRIARELHDVVAHGVSVMTVQAGAVRRLLRPEQEREREALEAVEAAGRDALAEMRRLLGVLRETDETPSLAPQPTLARVEELLARFRDAGLAVQLEVEGVARPLAPGIDVSAYRIVQEGLTNVLKHAGASTATVVLRYEPDGLELEIANDGAGAPAANGAGKGLLGMRERVTLYGGQFNAGPREGGGYLLRARLPLT
jgi:signal transduction histidine kinase